MACKDSRKSASQWQLRSGTLELAGSILNNFESIYPSNRVHTTTELCNLILSSKVSTVFAAHVACR